METKRTFAEIAREIKKLWAVPYFGAVPYLNAMLTIESTDKNAPYMFETAEDIVTRFLANAQTFRGADARRIKAELKKLINSK